MESGISRTVFVEVVLGEMETNDNNGSFVAVVELLNTDAARKAVEKKSR